MKNINNLPWKPLNSRYFVKSNCQRRRAFPARSRRAATRPGWYLGSGSGWYWVPITKAEGNWG